MPNKVIGIADTGTTLLLLPEKIVASYYAKVAGAAFSPESDGYIFPCTSKLPDFSFGVGQGMITIPGAYLAVEPSLDDSTCYGGIQRDTEIGFPIFGDMALKCAFVVFDYGNSRLGFAKKPLPPP